MLLTAGTQTTYNTMTVAWGSFGVMWGKPFTQVVVRPSRHTYSFIERNETFTLTAFPHTFKETLTLCGTKSGRECDKITAGNLTPLPSATIATPGFNEAELIIECKKMYHATMKPENFLDDSLEQNYNGTNYHTIYFEEILHIAGTTTYCKN